MRTQQWRSLRKVLESLVGQLSKYHSLLGRKAVTAAENKSRTVATEDDEMTIIAAKFSAKPTIVNRYKRLNEALSEKDMLQPLSVDDFTPSDRRRRHDFLKGLVLPVRAVLYKHSSGKNNVHFVWKIPEDTDSKVMDASIKIRDELRESLPSYHTRAMRREFISSFGTMTGTKSAVLREAYRRLTGDAAAPNKMSEHEGDSRLRELLDSEDPDIV